MIDFLLAPEIILVPQTSQEEISDLIKREELASLALTRFLSQEISWQDYLDCLEVAKIDVDSYLLNVTESFQYVGF